LYLQKLPLITSKKSTKAQQQEIALPVASETVKLHLFIFIEFDTRSELSKTES